MSRILDNLYLGSYEDAKNKTLLQSFGITHVATIGIGLKTLYPTSFRYLFVPAFDDPEYKLILYFDEIADFIHNAVEKEKGRVFIHCYAGISRSTTGVLAYLIKYHHMTPMEARVHVRQRRSIVYPNQGFVAQIEEYAKRFHERNAEKFKRKESYEVEQSSGWVKKPEEQILKRKKGLSLSMKPTQEASYNLEAKAILNSFGENKSLKYSRTTRVSEQFENEFSWSTQRPNAEEKGVRNPPVSWGNYVQGYSVTSKVSSKKFDEFPWTMRLPRREEKEVKYSGLFLPDVKQSSQGMRSQGFSCQSCKQRLFYSDDIVHNNERNFRGKCNAIYLKEMAWMKVDGGNIGTIYCPNSQCKAHLGYVNHKGGACSCGTHMHKMFVIYPLRVC